MDAADWFILLLNNKRDELGILVNANNFPFHFYNVGTIDSLTSQIKLEKRTKAYDTPHHYEPHCVNNFLHSVVKHI